MKRSSICLFACLFAVVSFGLDIRAEEESTRVRELLEAVNCRGGLVVVVGCGNSELIARIAASPSFLVHGIDADMEVVGKARTHLRRQEMAGNASVAHWAGKVLPFVDNLVNLIIVEDPVGLSGEEIDRVLAPGGIALTRHIRLFSNRGVELSPFGKDYYGWDKKIPDDYDVWTHHWYDATGVNAGQDQAVGPPRHLQWKAGPEFTRSHENISGVSVVVSDGGRIYSIIDEGPKASIYLPSRWSLIARDAFSGVLLWKKTIDNWHARLFPLKNSGASLQTLRRLVAVGDHVYVTLGIDAPVSKIDGATGKLLAVYRDTQNAEELLYVNGRLVVICNDGNNTTDFQGPAPKTHPDLRIPERIPVVNGNRSLVVIDPARGKKGGETVWKQPFGPIISLTSVAEADRVVILSGDQVKGVDLKSGEIAWERPFRAKSRLESELSLAPAVLMHDKVVYIGYGSLLTAYETDQGQELWSITCEMGSYRVPDTLSIHNGLLWNIDTGGEPYRPGTKVTPGEANRSFHGYDLKSGELRRTIPLFDEYGYGVMHHRCHVPRVSGKYIITSFPGLEFIDSDTGKIQHHSWIRGACLYGFMPANGLTYCPPHPCACYTQGKLNGFLAVAPERTSRNVMAQTTDRPLRYKMECRQPTAGYTWP